MKLIIDGYNLIKNIEPHEHISENRRLEFINRLIRYARKKNIKIVIVFDGGDFSFPSTEKADKLVKVYYSGYKETADEVIKDYIDKHKEKGFMLVSTDNELRSYAKLHGIESLSSADFNKILSEAEGTSVNVLKSNDTLHKTTSQENPELDILMEEASKKIIKKQEDVEKGRESSGFKLSKKERQKKQKLKKLL